MSYYVRMIGYNKWSNSYNELKRNSDISREKTHADVITTELRTHNNTISLWKIENLNEIDEIVLSLAMSRDKLARLDIMVMEQEKLETFIAKEDIKEAPDTANTAIEKLASKHYDIVDMTYTNLGELSECMMSIWGDEVAQEETAKEEKNDLIIKKTINEIRTIYNKFDKKAINYNKVKNKVYLDLSDSLKGIQSELKDLTCLNAEPKKISKLKNLLQNSNSLEMFIEYLKEGVYSFGSKEDHEKIITCVSKYIR